MMIISVCMYNQVWSSDMTSFREALFLDNDYANALIILNNMPLYEYFSWSQQIERDLEAKGATLSIGLITATRQELKENIQKQQEQLKIIAAVVSNREAKRKTEDIANQYGCSCVLQ